tara:strand:- start:3256 stop:5592 length:2337 start_codon:yes stop_codon:yes gene_type:complete
MSIKTTSVNVVPLRGMDQRWFAKPNKAELIEDMTWNTQDAWRQAGGWVRATDDFTSADIPEGLITIDDTSVIPSNTITRPTSIPTLNSPISFALDADTPPFNIFRDSPSRIAETSNTTVSGASTTLTDISGERTAGLSDSSRTSNAYALHVTPKTLHWFAQYNGAIQYLIYEGTDGGLYKFYGSTAPYRPWRYLTHVDGRVFDGSARKRTLMETEWEGTNFHTFAGRVYLVNGYDEPLVYDGRLVSRAGFSSSPTEPEVVLVDSENGSTTPLYETNNGYGVGSLNTEATYSYRVSFLNERGQESPMSDSRSITFTNGASTRHMITIKLPLGPPGTVARRIYRTQNQRDIGGLERDIVFGKEFYFLQEIQDNISTVFTDKDKDVDLGGLNSQDQYGLWSSRFNRIATFKNTLFLANSFESRIRYSEPRQPEELPVDNEINIGDSNAGEVVAMYSTKNALIVFKSRGIYLVKGNPKNGFFAQTLTKDIGCIASKSIREIPNLGLIFLSQDGFYMLKGALENTGTITEIVRLGQPIEDIFGIINTSSAKSCRSTINHRDKEYWLAAPIQGETTPSVLFKFHYEIGDWSISKNFEVNDIAVSEDHRNYVYIASSNTSTNHKGLYVYSRAYTSKANNTVQPLYKTAHISPRSMYDHFSIVRINPLVIGYGSNDLEMNFRTNRDLTTAYTSNLTTDQERDLEDIDAPRYGEADWDGTKIWWHLRPIPLRYDLSTMHKGPVSEIQFEFKPTGSRVQLIGFELELRIGSRREVVTLNSVFGGNLTR